MRTFMPSIFFIIGSSVLVACSVDREQIVPEENAVATIEEKAPDEEVSDFFSDVEIDETVSVGLKPLNVYEADKVIEAIAGGDAGERVIGGEMEAFEALDKYMELRQEALTGNWSAIEPDIAGADTRSAFVVNGLKTANFPTAGALLKGVSQDAADLQCSGTLVTCGSFLTAAHCFQEEDPIDPSKRVFNLDTKQYWVYLQHGGVFPIKKISYPTNEYNFPDADIAVVELEETPVGLFTSPVNDLTRIADNTDGTIVGFGRTGGLNEDYGIKRTGRISTSSCISGYNNDNLVCWNFPAPIGPPGNNSNTCHGDSGGPLFVDLSNNVRGAVAGVTSGGDDLDPNNPNSDTCLTGGFSFDASVYQYRNWVKNEVVGATGLQLCGAGPHLGDPEVRVAAADSGLNVITKYRLFDFRVEPATQRLVVTMNGETSGGAHIDFDLYVRHGAPPSANSADCVQTGSTQFAECEIDNPAPGKWYALVARNRGSGAFQVVSTQFQQVE